MLRKFMQVCRALLLSGGIVVLLAACTANPYSSEVIAPNHANQQNKIDKLILVSDQLYRKALLGDRIGVLQDLNQIAAWITEMEFKGITSIEGISALAGSVTEAKRIFNSSQSKPEEETMAAAKIRYATDALKHKHTPLWHQLYDVLINDLKLLNQNVKENRRQEAEAAFDKFTSHIATIEPAILIARQPEDVEKLHSLLTYVKAQLRLQPYNVKEIQRGIQLLADTLDYIFDKKHDSAFLPAVEPQNPLLWTIGIGAAIIMALMYTAWRMYLGQDDIVPVHRHGNRE